MQQYPSKPHQELSGLAGFSPDSIHRNELTGNRMKLARFAARVLRDPVLTHRLTERVFELMQADLQQQQERSRGYRSRF